MHHLDEFEIVAKREKRIRNFTGALGVASIIGIVCGAAFIHGDAAAGVVVPSIFGSIGGIGTACFWEAMLNESRKAIRRKKHEIDELSYED
jgi:hypothetical protein